MKKKDEQDLKELFWIFLRRIEAHAKSDDILDKRDVEAGYRLWNRIHNTKIKANWEK